MVHKSEWRRRLVEAIKASDKSMRSISLGAGLGPNYIQQLLKDGKEPTIGVFAAIAAELNVSVATLMEGAARVENIEEIPPAGVATSGYSSPAESEGEQISATNPEPFEPPAFLLKAKKPSDYRPACQHPDACHSSTLSHCRLCQIAIDAEGFS